MTEDQSADLRKSGWWSRFKITVEPIIIVLYLIISASGPPLTDLVMRQGCRLYGMDRQECSQHDEIEVEVHRISANFQLYRIVIDTLPGCLIALFASPWSDTNGRKPALLVALTGYTLAQGLLTWASTVEDIHPYTLLLSGLPTVTGGAIITILSAYCYLVDVTEPVDRSIRYSILAAAGLCAQVIGSAITPFIARISYAAVFGFGTVLLAVVTIYSFCFLPESVKIEKDKKTNFLTVNHLIESFRTYFKKRPNKTRGIVFALTLMSLTTVMMLVGEMEVKYQALIKVYHWQMVDYSLYTVITSSIVFVTTFGGVYVGSILLGIDEMRMALGIQLLGVVGSFLMAWAPTSTVYYLVTQFRCFLQCANPLASGIISKTIDNSDVAKVVSFMTTLDSFTPQLGTLVYSAFYNMTVGIYPFAIHLLTAALGLVCCLCIMIAMFLRMRAASSSSEQTTQNESVLEEIDNS